MLFRCVLLCTAISLLQAEVLVDAAVDTGTVLEEEESLAVEAVVNSDDSTLVATEEEQNSTATDSSDGSEAKLVNAIAVSSSATDEVSLVNALVDDSDLHNLPAPLNDLRYLGIGFYHASVLEKYIALKREILAAKLQAISVATALQRRFLVVVKSLSTALRNTMIKQELKLRELTGDIELVAVAFKNRGRDPTICLAAYHVTRVIVSSKISNIDIDVGIGAYGSTIQELVSNLINRYDTIMGNCRKEFPNVLKEIKNLQTCVSNSLRQAGAQTNSIAQTVNNRIETIRGTAVRLISATDAQVNIIIKRIAADFDRCNAQGLREGSPQPT